MQKKKKILILLQFNFVHLNLSIFLKEISRGGGELQYLEILKNYNLNVFSCSSLIKKNKRKNNNNKAT